MSSQTMYQPEIETMERGKLQDLQLERLKASLKLAYDKVPHYKAAFDKAGVAPSDLKSLDDFARFPFTVKTDLRDNYPYGLFTVPREQLVRLHASSGTTGKPTVVGYSKGDLELWTELMARTLMSTGVRPGDMVHNALGYGLFTGGLGFHSGAERLGCTVLPMSSGNTEKQIMMLQDLKATVLFGTPSYALNIAEVAEKMGVDLKATTTLRLGVFGAEPWSEEMRGAIERGLGVPCQDTYGLSEILGPGVAAECPEKAGLHGWEDNFLFEIVDPETLQPLPPGQAGELVITTLTKEALPMVRYRTRDISRMSVDKCGCGRTHARLTRIAGRSDDMLIIRGVNIYPSQIEAVMMQCRGVSPHYQLVVQREGAMDSLTLEVEAEPGMATGPHAYDDLSRDVQHHIKSLIGINCRVVVLTPGDIPRSMGKAVRVRDLRKA